MEIFDALKAKSLVTKEHKTFHIKKVIPDVFVYLKHEDLTLLNSIMLRVFEDFEFKKNIGHGLLYYDEKSSTLDLFLNYNTPIRLDLENDQQKYLYIFINDIKAQNRILDCTLDDAYIKDIVFDDMILQFVLRKENIAE